MTDALIDETLAALPGDAAEAARYDLGIIAEQAGDLTSAEAGLARHDITAMHCMGVLPERAVLHTQEKLKYAEAAGADASHLLAIRSDVALRLQQAGDEIAALNLYNEIIANQPEQPDGRIRLHLSDTITMAAGLYAGKGEYAEALALLKRGADMFTEAASYEDDGYLCDMLLELGTVHSHAENWSEAEAALTRASSIAERLNDMSYPLEAYAERLKIAKDRKPIPASWSVKHPLF